MMKREGEHVNTRRKQKRNDSSTDIPIEEDWKKTLKAQCTAMFLPHHTGSRGGKRLKTCGIGATRDDRARCNPYEATGSDP